MLLSDVEAALRLDLFDPSGSASQRWQNSDLDRAIDKAVDRYSQYYPNLAYADIATEPYQRTYPYPQSWNSNYPIWWLERIIYPLQVYGSTFSAPPAPTLQTNTGNDMAIGNYQYALTWLSQGGEATPSPLATIGTTSGNQRVLLTNLATGVGSLPGSGGSANTIIGRNIYRSQVGGTSLFLLATLKDTTTTSYLDSTPDSSLTGRLQAPTLNTSGTMYWPPRERDFAEYSNLFDSSEALAAGGNLGLQGAVGSGQGTPGASTPSFTLKLSPSELPPDNTLVMRVFYATKHQLDLSGSTIPEVHRDIIVLGASLYALEAYQVPTNDNFQFQDGALHDHLDDTAIPAAWRQTILQRQERFEARLNEIKNQRDFASSARIQWGDVPYRWPRL